MQLISFSDLNYFFQSLQDFLKLMNYFSRYSGIKVQLIYFSSFYEFSQKGFQASESDIQQIVFKIIINKSLLDFQLLQDSLNLINQLPFLRVLKDWIYYYCYQYLINFIKKSFRNANATDYKSQKDSNRRILYLHVINPVCNSL